ncbi:hypothetical protein AWB80_01078 [Caballeronia pedi]|uniref:Uncharacterized protein n=1 Tax=Caballeronia pedi TaxID=1777141 RepID=A0A157ZP16_9BURK|nr:hypothetical protein [Caballeronia pedi]SAK47231.1 hypothetical protein AWB80_01078 [Caballeronia pedi]
MASRKQNSTRSHGDAPVPAGAWAWVGDPANQKTLRFLGAAIAGAVALLVTAGVIGRSEKAPEARHENASQPVAHKATSPTIQNAVAASGGAATNVLGDGNQISIGAGKP